MKKFLLFNFIIFFSLASQCFLRNEKACLSKFETNDNQLKRQDLDILHTIDKVKFNPYFIDDQEILHFDVNNCIFEKCCRLKNQGISFDGYYYFPLKNKYLLCVPNRKRKMKSPALLISLNSGNIEKVPSVGVEGFFKERNLSALACTVSAMILDKNTDVVFMQPIGKDKIAFTRKGVSKIYWINMFSKKNGVIELPKLLAGERLRWHNWLLPWGKCNKLLIVTTQVDNAGLGFYEYNLDTRKWNRLPKIPGDKINSARDNNYWNGDGVVGLDENRIMFLVGDMLELIDVYLYDKSQNKYFRLQPTGANPDAPLEKTHSLIENDSGAIMGLAF